VRGVGSGGVVPDVSPSDGPGAFTIPKDPEARVELCDLIYDLADEHAARAVMDLPRKPYRVDFG